MMHRIVMGGFGHIAQRDIKNLLVSGVDCINYVGNKADSFLNIDVRTIWDNPTSLVNSYKSVQKKYFPEKDVLIKC